MGFAIGGLIQALFITLPIMAALWFVSVRIKKASIVDPVWAGLIALLAIFFGTLGEGYEWRRFFVTVMGVFWGMRLGFFILFKRVAGKGEDPRYAELLNKWGEEKERKLLIFFLLQGAVAALLSLPFIIASHNVRPGLVFFEGLGFVLWVAAFAGESIADLQLENFKSNPENKGKTCREGLWFYSRHPNYFFEFLIWCALFIYSLGSPFGILVIACPALILHFLFNVTGIPKAEEQAIRSRGDEYLRYQRSTNMFIPWFPRDEDPASASKA
ncbi:MAG: DUF1295 domain-containing protein [Candidatus Omnitrophota bacterium]|nr:DUF1295 domain-containing protein [Candidatus Omnitrophota bacterium]